MKSDTLQKFLPGLALVLVFSSAQGQQTVDYTDGQTRTDPIVLTGDGVLTLLSGTAVQ